MNCLRPGCDNELKSGRKYCSPGCAAKDRKRVSGEIVSTSKSYPNVPDSVAGLILEHGGSDIILNEINMLLEEEKDQGIPMPPLMNNGMTLGDWTLSMDGRDYRPYDALSFLKINDMLRCGAVKFALEMKIAGVASPFRTDTGWVVHSPDKELSEVVEANLRRILLKMVTDILYSALAYGVSFQELVWERKTKYELGLSDVKDEEVSYVVPKVPGSVNPETVKDILREPKTGKFLGFEQTRTQVWNTGVSPIKVEGEAALVVPYNERFRNLWGESFLLPLYPLWFWYEVIMRSMVRYMHRMATPVTVVKAPGKGKVNKPGTTTPVNSMMLGLAIAGNAANSNALVIPSDLDPETKQPLWDIFYLSHNESTQPFIDILEFLTQSMLRAALSGDRAVSQPMAGVGSKGLGEVHAAFTQLHNELILDQILMFLNFYFLPLYSLYNKGKNGPPVWLETQGLDPLERDNMFKLMGIAGNSQVFQEFFYLVDWKRMAESNSIPVLSEEERDALKAKLDEEALDKQEKFQEVQAKFGPAQKPGGAKDQAKPPEQKANAKLENDVYWQAVEKVMRGEPVPIVLSMDEVKLIAEHRGFDQETLKLFNPHHDSLGRFASKSSGLGLSKLPDYDKKKAQAISSYIAGNKNLSKSGWSKLSYDEKIGELKNLLDKTTAAHGLPPIELKVATGISSWQYYGYYNGKSVNISSWHANSNSIDNIVNTIVHESRHYYQHYSVSNPGHHSNEREVSYWKNNFENYLSADKYGYEAYFTQPIEYDANAFGNAVQNDSYGTSMPLERAIFDSGPILGEDNDSI